MPIGYRVSRGDGLLGSGDAVSCSAVTFDIDRTIGSGDWIWSGTSAGKAQINSHGNGKYHLATDGQAYFQPFLAPGNIAQARVGTAPNQSDNLTTPPSDSKALRRTEVETLICFTEGTLIATANGERCIDQLFPGDHVVTVDHGPQPLRWIGRKTVRASGKMAPIHFAKGSVGNHRDLLVSPQHRMLCKGQKSLRHFGTHEVLAPAKCMVDNFEVSVEFGGMVTYVHLLFDRHEMVIANGAASESFHPGGTALDTLSAPSRDELFQIFPALRSDLGSYGPATRKCVDGHMARALAIA